MCSFHFRFRAPPQLFLAIQRSYSDVRVGNDETAKKSTINVRLPLTTQLPLRSTKGLGQADYSLLCFAEHLPVSGGEKQPEGSAWARNTAADNGHYVTKVMLREGESQYKVDDTKITPRPAGSGKENFSRGVALAVYELRRWTS